MATIKAEKGKPIVMGGGKPVPTIIRDKIMSSLGLKKAEKKSSDKRFTEKYLKSLSFKEVKRIGKNFGTTDRSKKKLIKEILEIQGEQ